MICKSHNSFFETIGNKTRLRILELLYTKSRSVNDICKVLNEEQSKISHGLSKLKECRFLDVKKKGKKRIYSLNKQTMVPLMKLVDKHVSKYCGEVCKRK